MSTAARAAPDTGLAKFPGSRSNSNERMNDTARTLRRRGPSRTTAPRARVRQGAAREATPITRERLLDVAERLFVQHGFEATSLRKITAEAGANLAAVNYHFGSKESLVQEVLKRGLDRVNQERLRALDALEHAAGTKPLKPSKILEAFFGTLLRIAKDDPQTGPTFLKLLGRTMTEPADFIRAFLADEYHQVLERYKTALFKALPDVPRSEIIWRFHFMLGATAYAIAGTDILRLITGWDESDGKSPTHAQQHASAIDQLTERLLQFLIGGLRAPLPQFIEPSERKTP